MNPSFKQDNKSQKKNEDREIKRKPPFWNTVEPVLSSHPQGMVYLPPNTGGLLNKGSTELGSYEKTTQKAILCFN